MYPGDDKEHFLYGASLACVSANTKKSDNTHGERPVRLSLANSGTPSIPVQSLTKNHTLATGSLSWLPPSFKAPSNKKTLAAATPSPLSVYLTALSPPSSFSLPSEPPLPSLSASLSSSSTFPSTASSSFSSESSKAPNDFNVRPVVEGGRPPAERCPLCRQMRRRFFCTKCVGSGELTHSRARLPQRFSHKKIDLSSLERDRHGLAALVEEMSSGSRQRDELRQRIWLTRQRVLALDALISSIGNQIRAVSEDCSALSAVCDRLAAATVRLPNSKEECIITKRAQCAQMADIEKQLSKVRERTAVCVRDNIHLVRTYILPIEERRPERDPASSEDCATSEDDENSDNESIQDSGSACVSLMNDASHQTGNGCGRKMRRRWGRRRTRTIEGELDDACRTNYVRGRWVYSRQSTTNPGASTTGSKYAIGGGAACVPADGSYSQLLEWVQQRQEQHCPVAPDGAVMHAGAAFETAAGFMHLTQLVQVLALLLDHRLPHKLVVSEFSPETLTEEGLVNKVARLNANVVHLCLSECVDPRLVQPQRAAQNLLALFEAVAAPESTPGSAAVRTALDLTETVTAVEEALIPHLGLFDIHAEMELLGGQIAGGILYGGGEYGSRDSPDNDWEAVACIGPPSPTGTICADSSLASFAAGVVGSNHVTSFGGQRQRTASNSSTSSLFTSAAAFVTNLWSGNTPPSTRNSSEN